MLEPCSETDPDSLLRHAGLAQPGEIGGFVQRADLRYPEIPLLCLASADHSSPAPPRSEGSWPVLGSGENAGDHSEAEHCLLQPGARNAGADFWCSDAGLSCLRDIRHNPPPSTDAANEFRPGGVFPINGGQGFAMARTLPPTTVTGPIEAVIDEELLQDFNVKYVGALRCSRAIIPGSAAKELMVCRLTAGANRIRTPGPTFRPCWVQIGTGGRLHSGISGRLAPEPAGCPTTRCNVYRRLTAGRRAPARESFELRSSCLTSRLRPDLREYPLQRT